MGLTAGEALARLAEEEKAAPPKKQVSAAKPMTKKPVAPVQEASPLLTKQTERTNKTEEKPRFEVRV